MEIYATGDEKSPYIGKYHLNNLQRSNSNSSSNFNNRNVHTIIIMDVSGSMTNYVKKIITQYLPNTLMKLKYDICNDLITLITFSEKSNVFNCSISSLKSSTQGSEGCTYMKPAINNLRKVITESSLKQFRILTISDGELHDQLDTLNSATLLSNEIKGKYVIHSSAIRLFTSTQQPDTRGLSSILQLNNINQTKLIDFQCPSIDEEFVNVFSCALMDNLGSVARLVSSEPVFKMDPWALPTTEFFLSEGSNTFWLSGIPDTHIELHDGQKNNYVMINSINTLDYNNFDVVLKERISYYIERLKVLKVVNLNESKNEIEQIVSYFNNLEKSLSLRIMNDTNDNDKSIKARLQFFKKHALRKSKTLIQELCNIANNEKVSQLNSAQQAEFLRSAVTSSNTINLAKRGIKQGLDFDIKAIQEVKEMKRHLHELADIDDSNHSVSFYSQDTTLSGIKAVCALDDENESLEQLTAIDILSLLNIVGVGTSTLIGDYPDPKTYHLTDLMFGVFISMSDVLVVKQQNRNLTSPYDSTKTITNVVPFYDDDRIQQFLMKYAPNLLEYTASLGMRNMIVNVPNTYKYVIVGGVWFTARELQDKHTEICADSFIKFVFTYKTAVGNLFDYVLDLLVEQEENDNSSLYIGNNGTTNMIGPLIEVQNDENKLKLLPNILRALYTFEYYQVMRKFYRSDSDGHIKRKQMLDDLLGIDYQKYCSKLPALFEIQKVPDHHADYHLNQKIFDDITKRIYWIDYICQLSEMFGYALKNEKSRLLKIACHHDCSSEIEKLLGITFSLSKFKFYCIVQGLMFDTLASRYDETKNKMKIDDPGNELCMEYFLKDYIKKQYHAHYQSELSKHNKLEIEVLTKELVQNMIDTDNIDEFINLFHYGLTKNHVSVVITDVFKPGFVALKDKLFDPSMEISLRSEKLRILILGQDRQNNIIYNKGNTVRMSLYELENLTMKVGCSELWKEIYNEYLKKNTHLYRGSNEPNRHTHNNIKPSYWAYGFKNLREYFKNISKEEQDEYCRVHTHCCGVWDGVPVKWA
jgi:hypothetical protein